MIIYTFFSADYFLFLPHLTASSLLCGNFTFSSFSFLSSLFALQLQAPEDKMYDVRIMAFGRAVAHIPSFVIDDCETIQAMSQKVQVLQIYDLEMFRKY